MEAKLRAGITVGGKYRVMRLNTSRGAYSIYEVVDPEKKRLWLAAFTSEDADARERYRTQAEGSKAIEVGIEDGFGFAIFKQLPEALAMLAIIAPATAKAPSAPRAPTAPRAPAAPRAPVAPAAPKAETKPESPPKAETKPESPPKAESPAPPKVESPPPAKVEASPKKDSKPDIAMDLPKAAFAIDFGEHESKPALKEEAPPASVREELDDIDLESVRPPPLETKPPPVEAKKTETKPPAIEAKVEPKIEAKIEAKKSDPPAVTPEPSAIDLAPIDEEDIEVPTEEEKPKPRPKATVREMQPTIPSVHRQEEEKRKSTTMWVALVIGVIAIGGIGFWKFRDTGTDVAHPEPTKTEQTKTEQTKTEPATPASTTAPDPTTTTPPPPASTIATPVPTETATPTATETAAPPATTSPIAVTRPQTTSTYVAPKPTGTVTAKPKPKPKPVDAPLTL